MSQGQCLCGAVKIATQQPVDKISVCHCEMCQRWNGGPSFTIDCHSDVSIDGEEFITRFASSEWAERAFCKQCGTHLFYHLHTPSSYYVSSTLFEETKSATLAMQIFVDSKPAYYNFVEKTPMLTEQDIISLMSK
ncbi:GFA family protein [Providencia stuartii]|uniref:Aldehyde-activating protein n=1 Tax=Providencia stuartii TaxID=588 RepID=A0A1S1HRK7_PROST|nr:MULTISPECIES: GFA family protein [Providencia]MDV5226000.1 GFA family protein [Providencia rettgeri]ELR5111676.1 GFA family protein [Providencia stuartii]ELR5299134.1 GFA family protein [Providencia stuartii]MDW7587412.1 GFA family protein [Providencia sp. 2023EL-00965]OHT24954.1 aldehyde-activating protein [Providencia stuartii]